MILLLLINKIAQLLLVMLIGYIIVKKNILKSEDSMVLSRLCLYVIMPCTVIKAFQIEYDDSIFEGLMFAVAAALIIHIILFVLLKILKKFFHLNIVEEASVFYSNAGNLIIPLVSYVLGDEWIIYTSAFITVQMIFIWTHGVALFHKGEINLKKILWNVNLISIIIGIVLMLGRIQLPEMLSETMASLSDMIGPVAMLISGMLAAKMNFGIVLKNKNLYKTIALRLILVPGIFLIMIRALMMIGIIEAGSYIMLIVFLAVMTPSASTIVQFAQVYEQDSEYAGAINIVSTILCMFTMPLFVALYMM